MPSKPAFIRARIASFGYALAGLHTLWQTQPNVRIHAVAVVVVVTMAVWCGLSAVEWCLLLTMMGLVVVAEALNTAIEFLADAVSAAPHPLIKHAKDVAAAAVLIATVVAAVVGVVIFLPYWRAYLV